MLFVSIGRWFDNNGGGECVASTKIRKVFGYGHCERRFRHHIQKGGWGAGSSKSWTSMGSCQLDLLSRFDDSSIRRNKKNK